MLQACGPLEYNKWVLGIRKCLEKQLVPKYEEQLKKLTKSQGFILIKIFDEIVK